MSEKETEHANYTCTGGKHKTQVTSHSHQMRDYKEKKMGTSIAYGPIGHLSTTKATFHV